MKDEWAQTLSDHSLAAILYALAHILPDEGFAPSWQDALREAARRISPSVVAVEEGP